MKTIILAGGFAKRLWPLTKDTPKPLLDVGGKEIITRIIEKVEVIDEVDEIIISTNAKFEDNFMQYINNRVFKKPTRLVVEPTLKEGEKLGSIGGLNFLIEEKNIVDDVMILGGDNLFDFDLQKMVNYYCDNNESVIALKKIPDKELCKKYGICKIDKNNLLTECQEKPKNPESDLASTAIYIFTMNDFLLVKKYIKEGNPVDTIGPFINWLLDQTEIHSFIFEEDWHDIGSFEQLDEAREKYGE
jgi:glucose-1-phosphate thymidylyltransferase